MANITPDRYEATRYFTTRTHDEKDMVFYSGYAIFDQSIQGRDHEWRRDQIILKLDGPTWIIPDDQYDPARIIDEYTATVVPSSINNYSDSSNAGWAVDNCQAGLSDDGSFSLSANVAVRGPDVYIYRFAYQVTAIGNLLHIVRPMDFDPNNFEPR
jgi:hypothetical protein